MNKTRVYLTIDTECREERLVKNKIQAAAGYDLRIWGRFSNQKKELGIRLLMNIFEKSGLRASFYLDPFGSLSFGKEELTQVVRAIRGRGHDIQLHAHPIQKVAYYLSEKIKPPSDHMAEYNLQEQIDILSRGVELLVEAGVPQNELVSFRAGNFSANNDTWQAMKEIGLYLSSNYNPCYRNKGMKMQSPNASAGLFIAGKNPQSDVWELPISTFVEKNGMHRHLQITAISLAEMKHALNQAYKEGIPVVTIVTHSFEFYHLDSVVEKKGRINPINLYRLKGLCRFLEKHRDRFEVETLRKLGQRIRDHKEQIPHHQDYLEGHQLLKYGRLAEQGIKRAIRKMPILRK